MKTVKFSVEVEIPDEWTDEDSLSMVTDWLATAEFYHVDAMVSAQAAPSSEFVNEDWRVATIEAHRSDAKAIRQMIRSLKIVPVGDKS
jgi:hypothetical protein